MVLTVAVSAGAYVAVNKLTGGSWVDVCNDYTDAMYEEDERMALEGFGNRNNVSLDDFSMWMWAHGLDEKYTSCFADRFGDEDYMSGTYEKGNETRIQLNATGFELIDSRNTSSNGDTQST